MGKFSHWNFLVGFTQLFLVTTLFLKIGNTESIAVLTYIFAILVILLQPLNSKYVGMQKEKKSL
jgi:hypothetical protein